jgi:hypothetical protein
MSVFYIALFTIVAVFTFFAIIVYYFEHKERHNRTIFKYSVKLCVFFLILHNTIFTIPFFQLIFNMIICNKTSSYCSNVMVCYQNESLANLIFGILGLLLFFTELVFVNLFLNEMNPSSKLPSASFNLNQTLLKMVYKLFFCLFTVMDYTGEFRQYIVIGGMVVLLVNLFFFRLSYPPVYNMYVHKLSLFIDSLLFYAYLVLLVQIVSCSHQYIDTKASKDPVGILYILVGGVFVAFGASYLWRTKEHKVFKKLIRDLKNTADFVDYCVVLIKLIGRRDKTSDFIKLQGVFKLNLPYLDKTAVANFGLLVQSSRRTGSLGAEDIKADDDLLEHNWYQFLIMVLTEAVRKNPKSTQLKLLIAYIYYIKLKNKWKAVYCIMEMAQEKPSLMEQFSAMR